MHIIRKSENIPHGALVKAVGDILSKELHTPLSLRFCISKSCTVFLITYARSLVTSYIVLHVLNRKRKSVDGTVIVP